MDHKKYLKWFGLPFRSRFRSFLTMINYYSSLHYIGKFDSVQYAHQTKYIETMLFDLS